LDGTFCGRANPHLDFTRDFELFAAFSVRFVASVGYDDKALAFHCLDVNLIEIAGEGGRRSRDRILSAAVVVTTTYDVHVDALVLNHLEGVDRCCVFVCACVAALQEY
jgi:hypothetical protein